MKALSFLHEGIQFLTVLFKDARDQFDFVDDVTKTVSDGITS
jgi:hypothetical protein